MGLFVKNDILEKQSNTRLLCATFAFVASLLSKKMGLLVKIEILVKIEPFEWSEYVTNVNFLWFNIVGTTKMTNEKAAMHQHRSTGATFVNLHSDKHHSVMTVVLHHHNIMDATHVTMPCNASK